MNCREAVLLMLDQVDFTRGACSPFEHVGAVLPPLVLAAANAAYRLSAPDAPCRRELMCLIGNLDYTQNCCDLTAMVGAAVDTMLLEEARAAVENQIGI